ncbi:unnamed protein product [Effrenium voratum]|nr:unnamed protein product [Effrenium voratum]
MCGKRLQADVINYAAVMSAMEKGHRWQEALHLFAQMSHAKLQANTVSLSVAVSACEKGRNWQMALELFEGAGSLDVALLSAALAACDVGGCWERAVAIWSAEFSRSIQVNSVALNACLSACGRATRWELVLSILEADRAEKVDATSYGVAAQACAAALRPATRGTERPRARERPVGLGRLVGRELYLSL